MAHEFDSIVGCLEGFSTDQNDAFLVVALFDPHILLGGLPRRSSSTLLESLQVSFFFGFSFSMHNFILGSLLFNHGF